MQTAKNTVCYNSRKHQITQQPCVKRNVITKSIRTSVGIIGAGGVGSAIASSLIHKNIVNNIKISDANLPLCEGVALDLQDEAFITGATIEAKPVSALRDCNIIIITAGSKQLPDEPRINLIKRNAKVLKTILNSLFPINSNTIIILVSNPVDILTGLAQKWCAEYIPPSQIFGSGTYLDSQRLRVAISQRLGLSVKSIHAYVLGEHGDSQVIARSSATIGGCQLDDFHKFTDDEFLDIEKEVRHKAYEIIKRKGSTFHGIGACIASIVESVVLDKREIIPVSVHHPKFNTYLGWPAIVGSKGVVSTVPITLTETEKERLNNSANIIKNNIESIQNETL